ncbi:MAG: hypothetical protein GYB17_03960 [Gammaproteobacteria bacterium]|nr:hypothetical protein [Gammaproteobacteria bacterium]
MKNADMPAMPLSGDAYGDFAAYDGTSQTSYNPECQGLTKREHFAAMAMQGLLSNPGGPVQHNPISGTGYCNSDAGIVAAWSLEIADALLTAMEDS